MLTPPSTSQRLPIPFNLLSFSHLQYHPSTHQLSIDLHSLQPINVSSIPALLLPYVLLYAQAYLLLRDRKEDRWWRLGLWPVAVGSVVNAWLNYRWADPYKNIWNFMYGCSAVYFIIKSTEWAFIHHPPIRLNHPTTSSNLISNAFNLCCSTRMIGWKGGQPLDERRMGRWGALGYHLGMFGVHYVALDIGCWFCRTAFAESIGSMDGGDVYEVGNQMIEYFARWIPGLNSNPLRTPILHIFATITTYFVGLTIYQALCYGYHLVAILGMVVLGEEGEEWPVLMRKPWRATSLSDFWGRRWHAIFKQAFIAPTLLIPRRYPQLRSILLPLSAFTVSGIMHELGTITFSGSTSPYLRVSHSFLLLAVGTTTEVIFRRTTGRRVKGLVGFVWCWMWLGVVGTPVARIWLTWGLGGGRIIPDTLSLMACLDRHGLSRWLKERFV